jgi:hypothetical protein
MSAFGVKRALIGRATMTANGSKAEVRHCGLHVSYWREADVETSEA